VVLAAASEGVVLTEPASVMANPHSPRSGVRICLGGPSWDDLSRGLAILRDVTEQATNARLGASAM
jgi:DNA-binding transcriptional MocR family regulator